MAPSTRQNKLWRYRTTISMDGDCVVICHLQCEISSVSVTGLGCSGGELFLRCHIPAGGGRAIQIDSLGGEQMDGGDTTTTGGGAVSRRPAFGSLWTRAASCSRCGGGGDARRCWDGYWGPSSWAAPSSPGGTPANSVRRVELATPSSRRVPDEAAAAPVLYARISVRASETMAAPASWRRADSSAHPHRESGCEWSVGDEDVLAAVACADDDAFE